MKKAKYVLGEWDITLWFLIPAMMLFVWIIINELNMRQALLVTIFTLLFGWSFSFSKKKKSK